MRRFRLSTLMLLIVIAALGLVLVEQEQRADRHAAAVRAQLAEPLPLVLPPQQQETWMEKWPDDDGYDENDLIKQLNRQIRGKL
jgi:hypothetical protein